MRWITLLPSLLFCLTFNISTIYQTNCDFSFARKNCALISTKQTQCIFVQPKGYSRKVRICSKDTKTPFLIKKRNYLCHSLPSLNISLPAFETCNLSLTCQKYYTLNRSLISCIDCPPFVKKCTLLQKYKYKNYDSYLYDCSSLKNKNLFCQEYAITYDCGKGKKVCKEKKVCIKQTVKIKEITYPSSLTIQRPKKSIITTTIKPYDVLIKATSNCPNPVLLKNGDLVCVEWFIPWTKAKGFYYNRFSLNLSSYNSSGVLRIETKFSCDDDFIIFVIGINGNVQYFSPCIAQKSSFTLYLTQNKKIPIHLAVYHLPQVAIEKCKDCPYYFSPTKGKGKKLKVLVGYKQRRYSRGWSRTPIYVPYKDLLNPNISVSGFKLIGDTSYHTWDLFRIYVGRLHKKFYRVIRYQQNFDPKKYAQKLVPKNCKLGQIFASQYTNDYFGNSFISEWVASLSCKRKTYKTVCQKYKKRKTCKTSGRIVLPSINISYEDSFNLSSFLLSTAKGKVASQLKYFKGKVLYCDRGFVSSTLDNFTQTAINCGLQTALGAPLAYTIISKALLSCTTSTNKVQCVKGILLNEAKNQPKDVADKIKNSVGSFATCIAMDALQNTCINCNTCTSEYWAKKLGYIKTYRKINSDKGLSCYFIYEECIFDFLGSCLRSRKYYCCFGNPIVREIVYQGRKQLSLPVSTNNSQNLQNLCQLSLYDVQKIDFSKFDFSSLMDWMADKMSIIVSRDFLKRALEKSLNTSLRYFVK